MDRKDSADSVSMFSAIMIGTKTMSVVDTFGRMSRRRMRWLGTPRPMAASTNSLSRSASTWPRTGLAT